VFGNIRIVSEKSYKNQVDNVFRVLIIDKNTIYSKMVKNVIVDKYAFIDVQVVESAQEAILKAGLLRPEIVIMSIHTPGMKGLKLVERLRSLLEEAVVVVVSIYDMAEYRDSSLASGANYFFGKDAPMEELLKIVGNALPPEEQLSIPATNKYVASINMKTYRHK